MPKEKKLDIDRDRICREFAELSAIDSVSLSERKMADRLAGLFREAGFTVLEDDAGERLGGNAGNLYGFLKGTLPGPPILLSAHMDTVQPGIGKRAVIQEDGVIVSGGDTVLGADDLAGILEILEGVRSVRKAGIPHRDVEVLLSVGEEQYLKGSRVFDFTRIRAEEAYVLDLDGGIGTAALQAPSLISFRVTVQGKAAHAGFEPEKGIHAICIAGRALGRIVQGRIDPDTTLNIGTIFGGTASNIVPELCVCEGEVRSFSHEKALQCVMETEQIFREEAEREGASVQTESTIHFRAYRTEEDSPVVKRFVRCCEKLGMTPALTDTFGGSDNHCFMEHNIHGIVLSCGMFRVHSVGEYTTLAQLCLGAELAALLITEQ